LTSISQFPGFIYIKIIIILSCQEKKMTEKLGAFEKKHYLCHHKMMTIEEYRAEVLQALLEAKNEDGTPAITPKEAQEALNGFTDDELQDGILWNSPQDVADIILEG